jgi:hypothetical protein
MNYYEKYLKYKNKYIYLKNQLAGSEIQDQYNNLEFFFNYNKSKKNTLNNFNNFTDYNLVNFPIKRIGLPSNNGFINLVEFKTKLMKKNFLTIMKSTLTIDADNNYYEYIVGNCLNKIKTFAPNFVYTFNYMNLSEKLKNTLKNQDIFTNKNLFISDSIIKNKETTALEDFKNVGEGCKYNNFSSILIEYIPNSLSLSKLVEDLEFLQYMDIEIFNILFQVYAILSGLKNVFTHYDLHTGNVMFVKVPDNKIINITYIIDNKEYNLYTHFIPVILDYGRAFINCLELDNLTHSRIFTEIFCANKDCNSKKNYECNGSSRGMAVFKDENDTYNDMSFFYNINFRVKNESCDLRFLHEFMSSITSPIKQEYNKIFVDDWVIEEKGEKVLTYCVKENLSKFEYTNKVNNTTDVISWLSTIQEKIYQNSYIAKKELYGKLKIYPQIEKRIPFVFQKT